MKPLKLHAKFGCAPMFIFSEVRIYSYHQALKKGPQHHVFISMLNCMLFNAYCYVTDFVCENRLPTKLWEV